MDYNPMMRATSTQGRGLSTACSANIRITPLWKKNKLKKLSIIKRFDDQSFQERYSVSIGNVILIGFCAS